MNLLDQFISVLSAQNPAPSRATLKNYKADIAKFIRWNHTRSGSFTPEEITSQIIKQYQAAMTSQTTNGQSLSLRSSQRHLSSLRKFFKFLVVSGHIQRDPFAEQAEPDTKLKTDPYHLTDFKNHLYVFNASDLTIKNYITDVKQFFSWAQQVLKLEDEYEVSKRDIFKHINATLVEEYKERLHHEAGMSPVSINRKLSSLPRRRFT
jgi:site-specific recombinase XerD